MRGHIWTAFLNPIDCTPIYSTFFLTTLLSPFFQPKPLLYLSHSLLILILMLLLISGDIHPNPGPIDPCSVSSGRVILETDRYNLPTVLSGCTSPTLVFLTLTFVKSPQDTLGLFQCVHPLLKPLPLTSYPCAFIHKNSKSAILTHKYPQTHIFKNEPSPKQPLTTPLTLLITATNF